MKSTFKYFEILLLMCGVFGACKGELKSVMEGDSITLNPDLTQLKEVIEILWSFGDPGLAKLKLIAQSDENGISFPTDSFKGRLQLNRTGSLTISNMRINNSGLYKLEIIHTTGTSLQEFTVTVYESPSVIDVVGAEMKSVSVKEGDPVTLDVPEIHGDELIVWRFGDEGKLIAKHDIETKSSLLYNTDERFRDRLKLDHQTGSLIITNSRTTDSGLYKVQISSNKQTVYKRFTVIVSEPGLSPGAVAGIVVVLLVAAAAAAAAAAGVIYYFFFRISQLPSETLSVPVGDDVTLNPDTAIQTGDEIQWLFGAEDTLIAEIKKETRKMKTHDGPDMMFMKRLKLDETTGSLTIPWIETQHIGLYTLKIRRGRKTLNKKFQVSVKAVTNKVEEKSVNEGDSVTLNPDTKIQRDDLVLWMFGRENNLIAQISGGTGETCDGDTKRFKDRLKLNNTTGSLTITNILFEHTGLYKLQIISSSSGIFYKEFKVSMKLVEKSVNEGGSVTLNPDTENTKIQWDDLILWMFREEDIAQIRGETVKIHDEAKERFKDRLKLDKMTGSLTISNISDEHAGLYKLQIISSSRGTLYKKFWVFITPAAAVTNEARKTSPINENNDSTEKRMNESVTVDALLLNRENLDDEEGND